MTVPSSIALVGTGMMGGPIARAIASIFPVVVYDVDAMKAATVVSEAREAGTTVRQASTMPEVAAAPVVILMLPNSDIVDHVLWTTGLAHAMIPGSLVIDMGSSEPERTRRNAERLSELALRMLDAPVSGGVAGARSRTLTIMVGGRADDLAQAEPVLRTIGRSIHLVGDHGAGHAAKALNNLLSATGLLISIEAVAAAKRFGIDPHAMLDIWNTSTGRNHATETKIAQYVLSGTYDSGFAMNLMVKDLRIARTLFESGDIDARLSISAIEAWTSLEVGFPPGSDQTEIAKAVSSDFAVGTD